MYNGTCIYMNNGKSTYTAKKDAKPKVIKKVKTTRKSYKTKVKITKFIIQKRKLKNFFFLSIFSINFSSFLSFGHKRKSR